MNERNDVALKMLNTALDMEEKGFEFYKKAAEACRSEAAREVFSTLKKDEVLHMRRIKAIFEGLEGGGPWTETWRVHKIEHGDLTSMFREIAKKHGTDIQVDAGDVEAIEIGIDFENKAVVFYTEQLGSASNTLEKNFIEEIIAEERSHHVALADMKQYLTDPAAWFAEMERSGMDGG